MEGCGVGFFFPPIKAAVEEVKGKLSVFLDSLLNLKYFWKEHFFI